MTSQQTADVILDSNEMTSSTSITLAPEATSSRAWFWTETDSLLSLVLVTLLSAALALYALYYVIRKRRLQQREVSEKQREAQSMRGRKHGDVITSDVTANGRKHRGTNLVMSYFPSGGRSNKVEAASSPRIVVSNFDEN